MARSGSVNFTLNRNELIQSAFELIGVAVEGETLQSEDIAVAQRALNMMIKAWQAYGLQLWKRDKINIPLTASQASYLIGRSGAEDVTADRPLRILECVRKDSSSNITEMIKLSKQEYYSLSNLTTTGTPVQYFFDPLLDDSQINFWPVPDATAASDYSIDIIVQSPLDDMDAGTDDFDFPQEWLEAITYNLAVRLIQRYGSMEIQEQHILRKDARDALELAKSFDVEDGSIYFHPDMRGYC